MSRVYLRSRAEVEGQQMGAFISMTAVSHIQAVPGISVSVSVATGEQSARPPEGRCSSAFSSSG